MYVCWPLYVCFMLSCVGTDLSMGRSLIQGILPEFISGFIISEVNSKSEQARGHRPNPYNVQANIQVGISLVN
jgi:hypothetical protein